MVAVNPHQLFTFFLALLHSRMLSRLCRIPLLRENLCCARLTVSALGVLHAALRQPRNHRCFRPQQCAHGSKAHQRVCVWAQTPKASRPASKRRAEIRCSVCSSGDAGGLFIVAFMALALPHIPVSSESTLRCVCLEQQEKRAMVCWRVRVVQAFDTAPNWVPVVNY